jgi:hypothetical protein
MTRHTYLPVYQSTGGSPFFVQGAPLLGAFDDGELPAPVVNRLICHALIQHLQDSGLPEARERLAEMVSFYDNPPPTCRQLPHGAEVTVTMGPPTIRPVYPVTEED